METQTTIPASADYGNASEEVNRNDAPTNFTPLKIGADGSRVPYDNPPSFEQLFSDLFAGKAVVVMNGVNLTELYARHHQDTTRRQATTTVRRSFIACWKLPRIPIPTSPASGSMCIAAMWTSCARARPQTVNPN